MDAHPLSLYELNALVKRSITSCMPDTYWLQAELSDVRSNYSGHCYLEFVQKEPRGNNLIAKARGTIWNNVYRLLKPYFEEETGQAFVAGIKVLVEVSVEFHELYGYSLTVLNIDPTYTLGDMARRRREILKQLDEEGVLTLNKELELPLLTQRMLSFLGHGSRLRSFLIISWNIIRMALYSIRVFFRRPCRVTGWRRQSLRLSIPSMRGAMIGMWWSLSGEAVPLPIFRALIHTTWRQIARSFRCLSLPASVMNATILFLTVYRIHV